MQLLSERTHRLIPHLLTGWAVISYYSYLASLRAADYLAHPLSYLYLTSLP